MNENRIESKPLVSIVMGSDSDWDIMKESVDFLDAQGIAYECKVISAHRAPAFLLEYVSSAVHRGIRVFIAGAGGAAHLPGVIASSTPLPVIGVPVKSKNSIDGWDSILSILQMPSGVPVATVGLNAAKNAAILAMQILGTSDPVLQQKMVAYKERMRDEVLAKKLPPEKRD